MREACSRIADSLGSSWGYVGWALFLLAMLVPSMSGGEDAGIALAGLAALLLLLWWVIDAVDQCVPWWIATLGLVMLAFGLLNRLFTIAAWVIYWTKVRE